MEHLTSSDRTMVQSLSVVHWESGSRNRVSKRSTLILVAHGRTGMSKVSTTSSGENAWGVKYSILSPNAGLW